MDLQKLVEELRALSDLLRSSGWTEDASDRAAWILKEGGLRLSPRYLHEPRTVMHVDPKTGAPARPREARPMNRALKANLAFAYRLLREIHRPQSSSELVCEGYVVERSIPAEHPSVGPSRIESLVRELRNCASGIRKNDPDRGQRKTVPVPAGANVTESMTRAAMLKRLGIVGRSRKFMDKLRRLGLEMVTERKGTLRLDLLSERQRRAFQDAP